MTRVPCAEMEKAAPPWFRTPPDTTATPALACVRLDAPGHDVYITNFRTTLEVPEVWKDFYEPPTRDYHYDGSGGGTVSSASATDSRRFGMSSATTCALGNRATAATRSSPRSTSKARRRWW